MMKYFLLAYPLCLLLMVSPFLPGRHNPAAEALATFLQLYGGLGLLTLIPAALWWRKALRVGRGAAAPGSIRPYVRAWLWASLAICALLLLLLGFALSRVLGLLAALAIAGGAWGLLRSLGSGDPKPYAQPGLPLALGLLPPFLLACQGLLMQPLSEWSRSTAIWNARPLIEEIERFHARRGSYPLTLNALNPDYLPGVAGIDGYHYTYDSARYHVYFQQPTFFFDQIGTREMVAYASDGQHFMLSHVAWHMLMEPGEPRRSQGWYAAQEAGAEGWKRFWFD